MTPATDPVRRPSLPLRTILLAPVSGWAWLGTTHLAAGAVFGAATLAMVLVLGLSTVALMPTVVFWLGTAATLVWCNRACTAAQRARFAALLGVRIDSGGLVPRASGRAGRWRAMLAELTAPASTRQLGYHVLTGLFSTVALVVVMLAWTVGIMLTTIMAYAWALPERNTLGWRMHSPGLLATATVAGLAVLLAAPWLVRAATSIDVVLARTLLGPSRSEALQRRVESLARSRAGAVDAADAERRRIERDLHDGTQQRLTSLAMNLGIARETLRDLPEPAREAIVRAHEDAKQTLSELSAFVRGLHPVVLDDRGLDAALSGIAARSPVPVRLGIDLPRRPSPTIEAIAYFVVSEALTNVVKHASATQVDLTVLSRAGRLHLRIADDGRGGADPRGDGTGLRGLAQRVNAVDGTLRIDSPLGGPTLIDVELPCES